MIIWQRNWMIMVLKCMPWIGLVSTCTVFLWFESQLNFMLEVACFYICTYQFYSRTYSSCLFIISHFLVAYDMDVLTLFCREGGDRTTTRILIFWWVLWQVLLLTKKNDFYFYILLIYLDCLTIIRKWTWMLKHAKLLLEGVRIDF